MILDVKIDVGIRKSFSSDFNRKYDLCWEAGCVESIINTMVFNRFLVYRKIELRCLGQALWRHLEGLWCPWGHFWWSARVSKYRRKFVEISRIPGDPRI